MRRGSKIDRSTHATQLPQTIWTPLKSFDPLSHTSFAGVDGPLVGLPRSYTALSPVPRGATVTASLLSFPTQYAGSFVSGPSCLNIPSLFQIDRDSPVITIRIPRRSPLPNLLHLKYLLLTLSSTEHPTHHLLYQVFFR